MDAETVNGQFEATGSYRAKRGLEAKSALCQELME
jgi:hypothetical protein